MRIDAPIITGSFSLNGSTLGSLASVATTGSNTFLGGQSATSFAGDQLTANDRAYLRRIDGIAGTTIEVIAPISASAGITGSTNFDTIVNKPTLVSGSSQVIDILSSLNTATASFTPRITNLESKSSSVDISLSNINSYTSSQDTKNTTLGSYTGSNDTKWMSIGNVTGSYATTGSNTFFGTQTYSGSVYIANDLIVQGSSSIQYISASSVSIGTNIVQLNTANPSVRFAGLTIIDSGSIGGSGSFLYDSVHDEFVFVHRGNGSNITSSHFVLGPETYDSLGNETYLTTNILSKGTGKEHLVDSCIFDNGTTTCIKNNLVGTGTATIGSDILLTAANPVIYGGTAEGGVSISNNTGGSYIKIFGASHVTTPNTTSFINANSTVLTVNALGNLGIGTTTPCSILHVYGVNPSLIIQNSNTSTVGNTSNIIFRNLLSTGCIHFAGYIAGIQQSISTNTGDLSFNTYDNGIVVEGIRIASNGNVGIGTPTPCTMLHVQGQATIGCSTYRTRIDGSSAGTWISFGTLACTNSLGRIGTYESSYILDSNNGNISFRFANAEKAYINSSGQACFLGSITAANYNACGNYYARYGAGDRMAFIYSEDYYFGMTNPSSDVRALKITAQAIDGTSTIQFYTGNNCERVRITCGGNVGIGCSSPLNRLTVNGNIGMSNTYNWGVVNDNDANWGFRVCSAGPNYSTFLSYAGDAGSDRRGGIYNQNGHWVAYGNCQGHFIVQCNLTVGGSISGAGINGTLLSTTTQRLSNSTGGFANMVQKIHGAAGSFSQLVICVNLNGPGGWSYIINSGGTGLGQFQSGGGYINGPGNFSHGVAVGSGFTVTCHTCTGTDNVVRFVSSGGVHPFVSIQAFGSLSQYIDDSSIYIAYS
jgi:hypothetical protein